MKTRQKEILTSLIEEYIKKASPIGSEFLVKKYKLEFSSATVRNEMMDLEEKGFIFQPHTSAGRVPTEKGYKFYLREILTLQTLKDFLKEDEKILLKRLLKKKIGEKEILKKMAKIISEFSSSLIYVGFNKSEFFYTGFLKLFLQPEFRDREFLYNISQIIDSFDEIIKDIFDKIEEEIEILIGRENPFSEECATIISTFFLRNQKIILGLLAPMRMNYKKNLSIFSYSLNLLKTK